jgi:tetratricopeptide (TPR) repeat protein
MRRSLFLVLGFVLLGPACAQKEEAKTTPPEGSQAATTTQAEEQARPQKAEPLPLKGEPAAQPKTDEATKGEPTGAPTLASPVAAPTDDEGKDSAEDHAWREEKKMEAPAEAAPEGLRSPSAKLVAGRALMQEVPLAVRAGAASDYLDEGDGLGGIAEGEDGPGGGPGGAMGGMLRGGGAAGFGSADRGLDNRPEAAEPPRKGKSAPQPEKVTTWKRSKLVPNMSRLMIGENEELPLKGMQVNIDVEGFRARVLIDFYFYNDRGRQFEGTFKLRLPNEATPYFFAFGQGAIIGKARGADRPPVRSEEEAARMGFSPERIMADRAESWMEPKEARMVPKEKAAFAYTETVRRRVDPALMEWAGAGIFSSRVFPIAAGRLHRIVIGYDVDLLPVGKDLEYRFDLSEVPDQVIDLKVAGIGGALPEVTPKATPKKAGGNLAYRFNDPDAEAIVVRLAAPGPLALAGRDGKAGEFFAARFSPELASTGGAGTKAAVFMVDVSMSSNPEKLPVFLNLMKAILENNRGELAQFSVLFFNVETFWWHEAFQPNTPESVAALLEYAETLAVEGATDVGTALAEAARPAWLKQATDPSAWDLFLLSDGAVTWGQGDLFALANKVKGGRARSLFAYRTGMQGTDTRVLDTLARETGGAVFSVVGEAEIAAASVAHKQRPGLIESVELAGTSDLLLAGRPTSVFPGQSLVLVGRGNPVPGSEVRLKLRQGDLVQEQRVKLPKVLESELAVRTYGAVAVGQLEEFEVATEEVSAAYARHFRITGQTCSLLMLESEADYLRFNIKPEEDAFVIKTNPVAKLVEQVLASMRDSLGDPKKAFLAWVEKLEAMPGFSFKLSTALKMALKALPAESYLVAARPLACKERTWAGVSAELKPQLASSQLEYDAVVAESTRRKASFGPADALKALSSLVESNPGDGIVARDVGFSAMEYGLGEQAYHLFRRVAQSRPYEPQTYHAMALCLSDMGMTDLALAYFEIALSGQWDGRFGEFRKILGMDYLRFLRRVASGGLEAHLNEYAKARLETVSSEFNVGQADLVVMITWNTDGTDVDLHVVEPNGEECYYGHRDTRQGGRLTQDVTQGYGPEMYVIPKAEVGTYRVFANYFSSDRNRASTRTKVYATVFEGWGTPDEKVTRRAVALEDNQQSHDILKVAVR